MFAVHFFCSFTLCQFNVSYLSSIRKSKGNVDMKLFLNICLSRNLEVESALPINKSLSLIIITRDIIGLSFGTLHFI